MNEERHEETGPPVSELREVERDVSADFVNKIRRKIYRRTAAGQFASLTWHLPKIVLLEMVGLLSHIFGAIGGKKESQR